MSISEKHRAENELIKRLGLRDSWPIKALGYIKSRKAEEKLYTLLNQAKVNFKIEIALALWRINQDSSMIDIAIKESYKIKKEYLLIDMLYCMSQFNVLETNARIKDFFNHKDYFVAYNARRYAGVYIGPKTLPPFPYPKTKSLSMRGNILAKILWFILSVILLIGLVYLKIILIG